MLRRRPLARAAVIGGTATYAGKKHAQGQAQEQEQEARIQDLEAQQAQAQAAPAQPAPAEPAEDPMEKLKELAALKEQGILTDAEFDAQKQKILQQM